MELRDLHPTLQTVADRYPAFVRTSVKSLGFDKLFHEVTFPLKHMPTDVELFGANMPHLQHGEGAYRRQLTAMGVGEIVAIRQLELPTQVEAVIPAKRFMGIRIGQDQTVTVPGPLRRIRVDDMVAGGNSHPVSVLQYSTLSNGRTDASAHRDSSGRPGNYISVGQTMPDALAEESLAIVAERPEQARELARYIIEERIGIGPNDYSFPDFHALAAENIDQMLIGTPDVHNWSAGIVRPVSPDW